MNCKNCNSRNIKIRKNYSHGKSSKVRKSMSCVDCGSHDIEQEQKRRFGGRR